MEKFWRKLAREEYLIETAEFKAFARPQGDIKTMISKVPKLSAEEMLQCYRDTFKINEKEKDLEDVNKAKNTLEEFAYFQKKVTSMLAKFKTLVES